MKATSFFLSFLLSFLLSFPPSLFLTDPPSLRIEKNDLKSVTLLEAKVRVKDIAVSRERVTLQDVLHEGAFLSFCCSGMTIVVAFMLSSDGHCCCLGCADVGSVRGDVVVLVLGLQGRPSPVRGSPVQLCSSSEHQASVCCQEFRLRCISSCVDLQLLHQVCSVVFRVWPDLRQFTQVCSNSPTLSLRSS